VTEPNSEFQQRTPRSYGTFLSPRCLGGTVFAIWPGRAPAFCDNPPMTRFLTISLASLLLAGSAAAGVAQSCPKVSYTTPEATT
jgi:hypothetical protein